MAFVAIDLPGTWQAASIDVVNARGRLDLAMDNGISVDVGA